MKNIITTSLAILVILIFIGCQKSQDPINANNNTIEANRSNQRVLDNKIDTLYKKATQDLLKPNPGCTDSTSIYYDSTANVDDGSCNRGQVTFYAGFYGAHHIRVNINNAVISIPDSEGLPKYCGEPQYTIILKPGAYNWTAELQYSDDPTILKYKGQVIVVKDSCIMIDIMKGTLCE